MVSKSNRELSAEVKKWDNEALTAFLAGEGEKPEGPFELVQSRVEDMLDSLEPEERYILECRFGLKDGKTQTQRAIAQALYTNVKRVRRLERTALQKIAPQRRKR